MARSVAVTLREAALVMQRRGWTQNANVNEAGQVCAYGALGVVITGDPEKFGDHALFDQCNAALARHLGTGLVSWWNDIPGRTVDEVLAAFEAAAVAEEERARAKATGDSAGQGPDH